MKINNKLGEVKIQNKFKRLEQIRVRLNSKIQFSKTINQKN